MRLCTVLFITAGCFTAVGQSITINNTSGLSEIPCGSTVTLTADVNTTSSNAGWTFQNASTVNWYRNGIPVAGGPTVNASDSGTYQAKVQLTYVVSWYNSCCYTYSCGWLGTSSCCSGCTQYSYNTAVYESGPIPLTQSPTPMWFADADGDGYGNPSVGQQTCTQPSGYVENNTDLCPADGNKQAPGACGCGLADTDSDGDGTADCNDGCPNHANKTAPGFCGCGVPETDSDGDGTPNCIDGCVADVYKTDPGTCGCGVSDADLDSDGTPNCNDGCPIDQNKTTPGICGCGVPDTDSDGDGIPDCNDSCPGVTGQQGSLCDDGDPNTTGDVIDAGCTCAGTLAPCPDDGDPCTAEMLANAVCIHMALPDSDGDGACNITDGCPFDAGKTAPGTCGCGMADTDGDGDGAPDCVDACPSDANKVGPGTCGCGVADTDTDGDNVPNCMDGCPNDPNKTTPGPCGCGVANADTDGDGVLNCMDGCPNDPEKTTPGICGCGVADTDTDEDGTVDCNDGCPYNPFKTDPGACGCFVLDTDSDGDGNPNCYDACPNDPNKQSPGICGCGVADIQVNYYLDTDGDGFGAGPAIPGYSCDPLAGRATNNADNCPTLFGRNGDTCDDGNANTTNDVIVNCVCAGTPPVILVSPKVFLEGPFNTTTGLMSDALRSALLVPTTEPYSALGYTFTGMPGAGVELGAGVLNATGNDAIVDWMIVELRSIAVPTNIVASCAALVQRDGHVVALDGVSPVSITAPAGSYHVALQHRNHLGVMTLHGIDLTGTPAPVDFTTGATNTYGIDAQKTVGGAVPVQALRSGDVNFNGEVKYTGAANDRDPILVTVGSTTPNNTVNGYSTSDVNMDGTVKYTGSVNDRDRILVNVGSTTPNNTRAQQIP